MLVGCIGIYGERVDQALIGIKRLRPYVNRYVVIVDDTVTETQRKMLRDAGCEVYYHKFEDSMVKMRNQYLAKVQTGDWCIVHDPDEIFNDQFCANVGDLCKKAEEDGVDLLLINSHDTTVQNDGTTSATVSDFYKNLIYRKLAGTHYVGSGEVKEVHEELVIPGIKKQVRIDKRYWYEHVKYWHEVWERAMRNVFMGGGGCLTPDSIVITDQGFKVANDVNVQDVVINRNGKWTEVTKVEHNDYDSEIYMIEPFHGLPIGFSEVQKTFVLSKENNQLVDFKWIKGKDLKKTSFGHSAAHDGHLLYMPYLNLTGLETNLSLQTWIKLNSDIKNLKTKTISKLPLNQPDFWYIIGYWLADGSISNNKTIELAINPEHEELLREKIQRLFLKTCRPHEDKRSSGYIGLRLYHAPLARWLKGIFGSGVRNKTIPMELLALPHDSLLKLLDGLFDGDGTRHITNYNSDAKILRMVNNQIMCFAYLALLELGNLPSIDIIPARQDRFGTSEQYSIYVNAKNPDSIRAIGKRLKTGIVMPIKDMQIKKYSEVIDISVADGESFLCPYATIHNNNAGTMNPSWSTLRFIFRRLNINDWTAAREYLRKGGIDPLLKEWFWENRVEGLDFDHEEMESGRWYFEYLHPEEATYPDATDFNQARVWHPVFEKPKGSPAEVMGYIEEVYMKLFGRNADQQGKEAYTKAILDGALKREDLAEVLKQSQEYQDLNAESVRVNVPVTIDAKITEEIILQTMFRSKTYWNKVMPRFEVGMFLETRLGAKWEEFTKWYFAEPDSLTVKDFIKKLREMT